MRIGLLIYGSLDTLSGGYLYDRKLVEYLRAHGDTVEVLSLPWRSYPRHLLDNFSGELLARLQRLQVDVLLQDELNHPSLFEINRRLAQSKKPYPLVGIVHHLRSSERRFAWQNRLYAWVERRFLHTLDGFIFNSQATRLSVEGLAVDTRRLPWVLAYPAGDRFQTWALNSEAVTLKCCQPGPLRLVFVGSLIPRKGLHTLLEALAYLPGAPCRLDVVGSVGANPAYARQVQDQARQLGLDPLVHFHGALGEQDLGRLLAQAQVLVTPSSYEGFGIVYLEGMSFGLPAIGTSAGAAGEIITDGENGFLVPPEDPRTLSNRLQELCNDRPRLARLSLAARRRFETFPTWEQSAAKIRAFLVGLAGPAAGSSTG